MGSRGEFPAFSKEIIMELKKLDFVVIFYSQNPNYAIIGYIIGHSIIAIGASNPLGCFPAFSKEIIMELKKLDFVVIFNSQNPNYTIIGCIIRHSIIAIGASNPLGC